MKEHIFDMSDFISWRSASVVIPFYTNTLGKRAFLDCLPLPSSLYNYYTPKIITIALYTHRAVNTTTSTNVIAISLHYIISEVISKKIMEKKHVGIWSKFSHLNYCLLCLYTRKIMM